MHFWFVGLVKVSQPSWWQQVFRNAVEVRETQKGQQGKGQAEELRGGRELGGNGEGDPWWEAELMGTKLDISFGCSFDVH